MKESIMRLLYERVTTPEERARHDAEREYKQHQRRRARLYKEMPKLGQTQAEVDEGLRRLREVMRRGTK